MRHLVLEQWSRRSSPIHSLDAGIKLTALVGAAAVLSIAPPFLLLVLGAVAIIVATASRLPLTGLFARAAWVLPLSIPLAAATWDPAKAATLLTRSYLSALFALLFASTTPLPHWTGVLRSWRVPESLVSTLEFVYRYLFVIAAEAQSMRAAAANRGGFRFSAAAGAVAVLFARSWQRAENVHRAMLARGYQGRLS